MIKKKSPMKKKVISHLKEDIKNFHHEASEDKALIKKLSSGKKNSKKVHHSKKTSSHAVAAAGHAEKASHHAKMASHHAKKAAHHSGSGKIETVMHEFGEGELHSGSRKGPIVKSKKQAVAIAMSAARKAKKAKPHKKRVVAMHHASIV
jgi:hypothetical protein